MGWMPIPELISCGMYKKMAISETSVLQEGANDFPEFSSFYF